MDDASLMEVLQSFGNLMDITKTVFFGQCIIFLNSLQQGLLSKLKCKVILLLISPRMIQINNMRMITGMLNFDLFLELLLNGIVLNGKF